MINDCRNKIKDFQFIKKNYLLYFTGIFLFAVLCFYIVFFINQKSFIWKGETKDGLVQHYNALMYYGSYLRGIIKNILFDHKVVIPMWDFSIGYGADILATMHYYVLGDPLNLLSIFVKPKYTEYLYTFLILFRLYLAGLTFSYYCLSMNKSKKSTLIASITYIFCGYVIFAAIRHPYFINPMIYLPLLAMGVEKIFLNQSAKLFIFSIALSAISNFYFFYMLCLLIVVYALIRYFDIYGFNQLKNIPLLLCRFIIYALIGIAISAVILVPVIFFFLSTARSEYKVAFDSIYSFNYYLSLFFNFHSYNFSGYWTICSFSSLSILSIIVLFIKKNNLSLKITFIIATAFLCIPFIGYMFNGFSYLSNRWAFAYAFVVAVMVCWTFEDLVHLNKKEYFIVGIVSFIYFIIAMCFEETRNINFFISEIIMLIIYIIIGLCSFDVKKKRFFYGSILLLCIVSVSVNSYFKYSPLELKYINEYVDSQKGYSTLTRTRAKAIKNIEDDSFFRYDETNTGRTYLVNAALQQKQHSVSFFYSLGSGYVTQYFMEMENLNALSSLYTGLNNRRYLEALASVKYYIAENNQTSYLPYGFNNQIKSTNQYSIYQTDFALPLGYTYDTCISQTKYKSLTSLQKQQALLQGVCIEDDFLMKSTELQFAESKTLYKIESSYGIRKTIDGFEVTDKDAYVILEFDGQKNSELYLEFLGLVFKPTKNEVGNYITNANIRVETQETKNTVSIKNQYHTYYNGTQNFLVHLGYKYDTRNQVIIRFDTLGQYQCRDMNVYHLSMDYFENQINERKHNALENIQINTNQVIGDISLDTDKFVCLSIPYSEGWKIYVDGHEEKLYRANTMYMGVFLEEGIHHIELRYTTPFIKIGGIISGLGIVGFIIIIVCEKKRKSKDM